MSVHIVRKEEGPALRVLHECCGIDDEVEVTQKIALLEKKNDLLLHIHDYLQRTVRDIEKSIRPPAKASGPPALKLHFPMARAEVSVRTIVNSRVLEMVDSVEFVEAQSVHENNEESVLFLAPEGNDDTGILPVVGDAEDHARIPNPEIDRSDNPVGLVVSAEPGESTTNGTTGVSSIAAESTEAPPLTPPAAVQFTNPLDDRSALETESEQAIQRLQKVQSSLLKQVARLTDVSVALHREHYKEDIAEPSTLAVALLQRARAAERAYDGAQAMRFTEQAEVAAVRALGGGSQLAISIMLEVNDQFNSVPNRSALCHFNGYFQTTNFRILLLFVDTAPLCEVPFGRTTGSGSHLAEGRADQQTHRAVLLHRPADGRQIHPEVRGVRGHQHGGDETQGGRDCTPGCSRETGWRTGGKKETSGGSTKCT